MPAVHPREPEVEDDEVGGLGVEGADRVGPVGRDQRLPAVPFEPERDELGERRLVLDDEDPLAAAGDRAGRPRSAHGRACEPVGARAPAATGSPTEIEVPRVVASRRIQPPCASTIRRHR